MAYSFPTTGYTVQFLERLYFNVPPLVPKDLLMDLKSALDNVVTQNGLPSEIDDIIIFFGKKLWPYNQAFEELCAKIEKELGTKLFMQKASYPVRVAMAEYEQGGGSLERLFSGADAHVFSAEIRLELHQILVDIRCDIRSFAHQSALSTDKKKYLERVAYFETVLKKIEIELAHLHKLADAESDIPVLADEIRGHARDFELSLVKLGPQFDYEALCNAHEHFVGRKKELLVRATRQY
jgi:hypothetical protein